MLPRAVKGFASRYATLDRSPLLKTKANAVPKGYGLADFNKLRERENTWSTRWDVAYATKWRTTMNLSYETFRAQIKFMSDTQSADFAALGVPVSDAELLASPIPWSALQRDRVMKTYDALLFGHMTMQGMNRVQLPAETLAAAAINLIHPVNLHKWCYWISDRIKPLKTTNAMAQGDNSATRSDDVTAGQMVALCNWAYDNDYAGPFFAAFQQKLGLRVEKQNVRASAKA